MKYAQEDTRTKTKRGETDRKHTGENYLTIKEAGESKASRENRKPIKIKQEVNSKYREIEQL